MRALCALRAVEDWLAATDEQLEPGSPLFPKMRGEVIYPEAMSLRPLDLLVKRVAKKANLDGSFSTHSLRAGCATSLYSLGVEEPAISRHLRHQSVKTTRIYRSNVEPTRSRSIPGQALRFVQGEVARTRCTPTPQTKTGFS